MQKLFFDKATLEKYISDNRLKEAIENLIFQFKEFLYKNKNDIDYKLIHTLSDALIINSGKLKGLEQDKIIGIIDKETQKITTAEVQNAVLYIINQLPFQFWDYQHNKSQISYNSSLSQSMERFPEEVSFASKNKKTASINRSKSNDKEERTIKELEDLKYKNGIKRNNDPLSDDKGVFTKPLNYSVDTKSLNDSLKKDISNKKKIVFLIGSGMSLSSRNDNNDGIGGTNYFINKFEEKLKEQFLPSEKQKYHEIIRKCNNSKNQYSSFAEVLLERGININDIYIEEICPVLSNESITKETPTEIIAHELRKKNVCNKINLNNGLESFGKLAVFLSPTTKIITSNIDPFIEIVLTKNEIDFLYFSYSFNLSTRKDFEPSKQAIILEHYHGYWLKDSMHSKLNDTKSNSDDFEEMIEKTDSLYVFGFGGWEDAFTNALENYLNNTRKKTCKIHWSFLADKNSVNTIKNPFIHRITDKINQNKVKCYYKIDTNDFFPQLLKACYETFMRDRLVLYKNKNIISNESFTGRLFEDVSFDYGSIDKRSTFEKLNKANPHDGITKFIISKFRNCLNLLKRYDK